VITYILLLNISFYLLFYIDNNNIGGEGAKALAESFTKNQSITEISLCNYIYIIIKYLFYLLFYIGDNNIGDEGANALAKSFTKNQSITNINLRNYIYYY